MAFIKQEALEKAREIKVKADEEFAIEKVRSFHSLERCGHWDTNYPSPWVLDFGQAKLVKQEQQAIDAQYEKKRKGAEVSQKMSVFVSALRCQTLTQPT